MFENNFDFSEASIPESYELEHALSVFSVIEKRGKTVDYAVAFNPRMDYLPKENALAMYFLLRKGNDSDQIRVLEYMTGSFCVRIDDNFKDLISDCLRRVDTSEPVFRAALQAFSNCCRLSGDDCCDELSTDSISDMFVPRVLDAASKGCADSAELIEHYFSRQAISLCPWDETLSCLYDLTIEGRMLHEISSMSTPYKSAKLVANLQKWYESFVQREDTIAALLVASALKALGTKVEPDSIAQLIPQRYQEWGSESAVVLTIKTIVDFRLLSHVPSILALLATGDDDTKHSAAAALILLDQSAEDMADVIVKGIKDGYEMAQEEADNIVEVLQGAQDSSPEQQFALAAISAAIEEASSVSESD